MSIFGKKGDKKKQLEEISSNKILVRVFSVLGNSIWDKKAEYEAIEKRDQYNNLVSINEGFKHDEDVDFCIDDVYRAMNITLGLDGKTVEEKLAALNKKIERQERLIQLLDKYVELNALFNFPEEDLTLRDLQILKNNIKNQHGNGSYFTIENGRRVYSFQSTDGFLVPIWHGVDTHSQYPDHTRKKKITIQEDQIFAAEMAAHRRENKLTMALVLVMGLTVIVFIVLCVLGWKMYEKNQTMDEKIHGAAFQCAEETSQLNRQFAQMMTLACVQDYVKAVDDLKNKTQAQNQVTRLNPNVG